LEGRGYEKTLQKFLSKERPVGESALNFISEKAEGIKKWE